jgi:hypothetical protein
MSEVTVPCELAMQQHQRAEDLAQMHWLIGGKLGSDRQQASNRIAVAVGQVAIALAAALLAHPEDAFDPPCR